MKSAKRSVFRSIEAIRLSLDQLEHRGPGLVAYYRYPTGGQFISWVE